MLRTRPSNSERTNGADPLAPAAGFLVALGLSVPLWLVVGGLMWLGRGHMKPVVGSVLAWAVALAHLS